MVVFCFFRFIHSVCQASTGKVVGIQEYTFLISVFHALLALALAVVSLVLIVHAMVETM